jgi:hypothetical protein
MRAVSALIAEIVHDIDLKDAKFGREQTPGIALLISGICISHKDDFARIERGGALRYKWRAQSVPLNRLEAALDGGAKVYQSC